MIPFELNRLGMIMAPEPGNSLEVEGVLNPGVARGPDGNVYIFPRMVAAGNYSRIGIARVRFNKAGDPEGVERLGVALEPEAEYEKRPDGGGCEDPRITFVEPLASYVMTYTAFSAAGPRIALAISKDLFNWERIGLATFEPYNGLDFNGIDNKDAVLFPVAISDVEGVPALAMIHRPLFPGTEPHETVQEPVSREMDIHRESMWISYSPLDKGEYSYRHLHRFESHHRLACPVAYWERLKIGGGTPPVLTRHGWLLIYHGVCDTPGESAAGKRLRYSAGAFVLSREHPRFIQYRSSLPILSPELPPERDGAVANVVFPTGLDQRKDLGQPERIDVYYGMADSRIGAASMRLPDELLSEFHAPSCEE
ncbi:MAG: glycosidase [Blastocatellia bacterium AA13]|nr:MAG: glycosidase [Blastocatellia bacterium AA13]